MARCKNCSAVLNCKTCACKACGLGEYGSNEVEEVIEAHKKQIPDNKPKMPSMFQQAKNFTKAVAKHAMNGGLNVPKNVKKSRMDLCSGCEFLSDDRCSKCGCFVDSKTNWASESCPIGKWATYKPSRGKCGKCGRK